MNAWRRWRETRARFLVLAALTALSAGMVAGRTPDFVARQLAGHTLVEQGALRLHRIDSEWFGNKGPSALLLLGAIFFMAGGPATELGRGSTLFTFALPVSRRRVLLAQLGVTLGLLAALGVVGALAAMIGGALVGVRYPVIPALLGLAMQVVSVAPFAAVLMAVQTATRRTVASAAAVLGVALAGPPLAADYLPPGLAQKLFTRLEFPPMIPFEPAGGLHAVGFSGLADAVPWPIVSGFLLATVVATAVAVVLFERAEP